jgi:tetratricopeptide (TPR) repeat protein
MFLKYLFFISFFFNFCGLSAQIKDSLLFELQKAEVNELNERGHENNEHRNWITALNYYKRAAEYGKNIGYKSGQAEGLRHEGLLEMLHGKKQNAEKVFFEELKIRKELKDLFQIAHTYKNIGDFFEKIEGNSEYAFGYFLQAYHLYKDLKGDKDPLTRTTCEDIIKSGFHIENVERMKKYQNEYIKTYFLNEKKEVEAIELCLDWSIKFFQSKAYTEALFWVEKAKKISNSLPQNSIKLFNFQSFIDKIEAKKKEEDKKSLMTKILAFGILIVVLGIGIFGFYWSWKKILVRSKK